MKRTMPAVLAATLLLACDESNPLIGKWRATPKNTACAIVDQVEFTEKLAMMGGLAAPVKYSRDGARHIAALGNGQAFVFEKDGDGLRMVSPFDCRMTKAKAEPSKAAPSKAETVAEGIVCNGILQTLIRSDDIANRVEKTMSASDKPLDDRIFATAKRLGAVLDKLNVSENITEKQADKAFDSGEAIANKLSTYAEMKARLDQCESTIMALSSLAGTK